MHTYCRAVVTCTDCVTVVVCAARAHVFACLRQRVCVVGLPVSLITCNKVTVSRNSKVSRYTEFDSIWYFELPPLCGSIVHR